MSSILSIPSEQYHSAAGISKSQLDWITPDMPGRKRSLDGGSPAHFRARFITGLIEDKDTPAKQFGRWQHRFILEPETMENAFHMKPEGMSFATKEGKAWKAEHSDRSIIDADDFGALVGIRDAVWAHPVAGAILKSGEMERSLFAEDEFGTLRKGRLDIIRGNVIADLKTIECASEGDLEAAIWDRRYFCQGYWYLRLAELCDIPKESFVLIFVEKSPPYDVVVRELDDSAIEAGRIMMEHDARIYRECMASGVWPGRDREVKTIGLPEWAKRTMEKEGVA